MMTTQCVPPQSVLDDAPAPGPCRPDCMNQIDRRPQPRARASGIRWLDWLQPIRPWLRPDAPSPFTSPANTRRRVRVFLNGNVVEIPPK